MLDDLFDMVSDRSRNSRGASSGGLLGKISQLLGGDSDEESRHSRERRYDERDDRPRERERAFAFDDDPRGDVASDRRGDDRGKVSDSIYKRRDDDHDDDERESVRGRQRRAFDLDFDD